MSSHAPASPDTKRKQRALPSILSNIRNAQAAIGRAADDRLHAERETRPLVAGSAARPQLHRGSASASALASTLHNFSERFGSQWRKHSRRRKGGGVTIVPQSFFVAVGCFFVAFPVIFILYILARHSVFGDEGDLSVHNHEVPSSFANGMAFESGAELLERNKIDGADQPEDASGNASKGDEKQSALDDESTDNDAQAAKEGDGSALESSNVQSDEGHDHPNEADDTSADDIAKKSESVKDSIVKTKIDGSNKDDTTIVRDAPAGGESSVSERKDVASSNDMKEVHKDETEQALKASSDDASSVSVRKDTVEVDPSSDQVGEKAETDKEKKSYHDNGSLRGSQDEEK